MVWNRVRFMGDRRSPLATEVRREWLPAFLLRRAGAFPGVAALVLLLCAPVMPAQTSWVSFGPDGKLHYDTTATGDRIADFSSAGYHGGGVALPKVPVQRTVKPTGGDDTAVIQKALDEVGGMPLVNGRRGAVLLDAGVFHCAGVLTMNASGVVLRGAGAGDKGTDLVMTGDPDVAIRVAGSLHVQPLGDPAKIVDAYVPSGAFTFHVNDARAIHAGDTLLISKPITPAWVHFMDMDTLGMRNGKPEKWISGTLSVRRRVASVRGNAITLEVPLMDSYDSKYLGDGAVSVARVAVTGQISEVGVEDLRVSAPARSFKLGAPEFDGLKMTDAADSWATRLAFEETTDSVAIDTGTERVSVVAVDAVNHVPVEGAAKPFMFEAIGQQILFDRCTGTGDNTFYFATQQMQQGPVVVLHCRFQGDGHIQPHQRWSTGLLIDSCGESGSGGIDLMNRGMMGSGHGWAIGWSVIWNSTAPSFAVNSPPGGANWSIGNKGEELNPPRPAFEAGKPVPLQAGIVVSPGTPVKPASLYLEQLSERLGKSALRNIGY